MGMITPDTPAGTRVKWGGGAAPIGYGRTASPVTAQGTVIVVPDGGGTITADNDIAELDYDTEHGNYVVLFDSAPATPHLRYLPPAPHLTGSIADMRALYQGWCHAQGFSLASTEELLYRTDLTDYQSAWLMAFETLWDIQTEHETSAPAARI